MSLPKRGNNIHLTIKKAVLLISKECFPSSAWNDGKAQ